MGPQLILVMGSLQHAALVPDQPVMLLGLLLIAGGMVDGPCMTLQ